MSNELVLKLGFNETTTDQPINDIWNELVDNGLAFSTPNYKNVKIITGDMYTENVRTELMDNDGDITATNIGEPITYSIKPHDELYPKDLNNKDPLQQVTFSSFDSSEYKIELLVWLDINHNNISVDNLQYITFTYNVSKMRDMFYECSMIVEYYDDTNHIEINLISDDDYIVSTSPNPNIKFDVHLNMDDYPNRKVNIGYNAILDAGFSPMKLKYSHIYIKFKAKMYIPYGYSFISYGYNLLYMDKKQPIRLSYTGGKLNFQPVKSKSSENKYMNYINNTIKSFNVEYNVNLYMDSSEGYIIKNETNPTNVFISNTDYEKDYSSNDKVLNAKSWNLISSNEKNQQIKLLKEYENDIVPQIFYCHGPRKKWYTYDLDFKDDTTDTTYIISTFKLNPYRGYFIRNRGIHNINISLANQ